MSFLQDIFGGSSKKETSSSSDLAYPWIQQSFGAPSANAFSGGTSAIGGLLGLGGGDPSAFQKFTNSSGYNFLLNSGSRAITDNAAAKGLLNSGSTLKALTQYGQNLGSTQLQNYLGNLTDYAKLGLGGGSLISGAGQVSSGQSKGSSSDGMITDIAAIASLFSDRRLKTNIRKLREAKDGLGIYQWNWKSDPNGVAATGVLADEVERLRPWAFLQNFKGTEFSGVNYGALGSLA